MLYSLGRPGQGPGKSCKLWWDKCHHTPRVYKGFCVPALNLNRDPRGGCPVMGPAGADELTGVQLCHHVRTLIPENEEEAVQLQKFCSLKNQLGPPK
ncbi:hypothetical protein ROHU_006546 [Labeo rohita]|uniref:Uncharacterized protein n=1 Tax=Labeo rohita TaxID=84645 RepID=A0A498N238_LABRO|nr:hypothetical protein ROHU_032821 [Labeo rohita]RXN22955.1 hypothetical protein ROHU_006546 [Labeo rohita]